MNIYRALYHQKMKLARKKFIIRLILVMFLLSPVLYANGETISFIAFLLVGAIAGGMNYGVRNMDIESGWRRYLYVLPLTPVRYAVFDFLLLIANIVLYGSITMLCIYVIPGDHTDPLLDGCLKYLVVAGVTALIHILYNTRIEKERTRTIVRYVLIVGVAALIFGLDMATHKERYSVAAFEYPAWIAAIMCFGLFTLIYYLIFQSYNTRDM